MRRPFTLAVVMCLALASTAYARGGAVGAGASSGGGRATMGVRGPSSGAGRATMGVRTPVGGMGLGITGSTFGTTVVPGTIATGGGRDIPSPDALTRVPN